MTIVKTVYECRKCKSRDVEGTIPAWFKVNEGGEPTSFDSEASWGFGYCNDCKESDFFFNLCRTIEIELDEKGNEIHVQ